MARVVLEQVSKVFRRPGGAPVHAVRDLSLTVEDGELLALLGPSGCGKTTTLRLIAGLEEPCRGAIAIDGRSVNGVPPQERDLAMVFQNLALFPHLSVLENLALGPRLRRVPRAEIAKRIEEVTGLLGLAALLDRAPGTLSGGERQRVALARALVKRPRVLLLDEPLSDLDAVARGAMRRELLRLHRELGLTLVYVTHDQIEAAALGGRVALMKEGALQQAGRADELYDTPANLFVAGFFGEPPMNLLEAVWQPEARGGWLICRPSAGEATTPASRLGIAPPLPELGAVANQPLVVGFRPEHLRLEPRSAATDDRAEWAGRVEGSEYWGGVSLVRVACSGLNMVAVATPAARYAPGQPVVVRFDLAQAHWFEAASGRRLSAWPTVR